MQDIIVPHDFICIHAPREKQANTDMRDHY